VDDTAVRHEISNLGRKSNLEGMEETDINELLNSHNHEFSNEELLQLQLQIDPSLGGRRGGIPQPLDAVPTLSFPS